MSRTIKTVSQGNLCSGCGACELIAGPNIEIRNTADGFIRPTQLRELSSDQEGLIAKCCPGLVQVSCGSAGAQHPLWGHVASIWTGHSTDEDLRRLASSGGGLSAALLFLLGSGKVDGVVQVRASETLPYANAISISTTIEEIAEAAGSRYAPSAPLAGLRPLMGSSKRYAFVGKPCDVAALRALINLEPALKNSFPYLLSFFCAGVPSTKGAEEVIRKMGADPEQVTEFRYRGNGWPGHAVATLADGTTCSMSYHDSWGGVLSNHVQHRCKICADGTGDAADIVFADAWEADERGYPLFEERDGRSLILVRTPMGQTILEGAVHESQIAVEPFDIAELEKIQPGQTGRRRALLARLLALRLLGKPTPRYQGFSILAAARTGSFAWSARNFLGMARRILLGRAP